MPDCWCRTAPVSSLFFLPSFIFCMKQSYPAASRLLFFMLSLVLLGVARPASLRAQTYALPASGTNNFTTCSGTLTDDGGLNAPYSPSANGSTTLTPATAGNKIRLQFTSFSVESGYDLVHSTLLFLVIDFERVAWQSSSVSFRPCGPAGPREESADG